MFKKNTRKERVTVYKSIIVCTSDGMQHTTLSAPFAAPRCRCPSVLWMATELKVVLHDIGDELETLSLHISSYV